jgi:tetratricopeptide (TPR) repeat protein
VSVADLIAEAIAKSLLEVQPIDIYDYRDMGAERFGISPRDGAEWLMRIRIMQIGGFQHLTLLVYRTSSMKLVVSHSIQVEGGGTPQFDSNSITGFIAQSNDRLAATIFGPARSALLPQTASAKTSYAALNLIFLDNVESLDTAERLLEQSIKLEPQPVSLGLLTYISSFRIGERLGEYDDHRRAATEAHARQLMDADPYNSLALACLGHFQGYVMRDFEAAGELLTRAIALNPHQAFAWDHYALYNLYIGKLEEALRASRTAVHLGSYSPLRYSFETTLAMVSTLLGDHNSAIQFAKRALSRQPTFKAAKRYLIAAYGMADELKLSEELIQDLVTADPDFTLESVRGDRFAVINPNGREFLLRMFRKAGLK